MTNKKKLNYVLFATGLFTVGFACTLALTNRQAVTQILGDHVSPYSITLNSDNSVTSAGEHKMSTDQNKSDVTFTYSNVKSSTSGHVTLNSGGYLVNMTTILSIENVTCSFNVENSLSLYISADNSSWSDPYAIVSHTKYDFGSAPYYVKLVASKEVTISSLSIGFSCSERPGGDTSYTLLESGTPTVGSYVIIASGKDNGSVDALSKTQNANNRGVASATVASKVLTPTSNVAELLVGQGTASNSFSFYDASNDGYLYAASSGNNYLRTQNALDANGSFSISISSGVATIEAQGSNTRNNLRYNSASSPKVYSCYASTTGAAKPYIYQRAAASPVYPSEITISGENEVKVGKTITLSTSFTPIDTTYTDVNWTSGNTSVATVTSTGVVTGVAEGTTKIYASCAKAGVDVQGEITITVSNIVATSVSLNKTNLSLTTGQSDTLTATVSPSDTTNKNVTWVSNNTSVATVSSTGVVTAVAPGNATITVTTVEGGRTATCSVTVTAPVAVTGVTLNTDSTSVEVDSSVTLTATVSPNNAANKNVTWTSSKTSVATVSNGTVTGVSAGSAVITVTTVDGGYTATCIVTVTAKPVQNWVKVTDVSDLQEGAKVVIGSASNSAVAGALSSKILESVSCTFASNKIENLPDDALQFTLGKSSSNWTFSNSNNQLLGSSKVKELFWGSGTTTWTISISSGSATIYNTNSDYGRFLYNVNNPRFTTYTSATSASMVLPELYVLESSLTPVDPTDITLSSSSLELSAGDNSTLSVSYIPSNANQNKEVTWTSSNEGVATVNSQGKVTITGTANIGDKATITATLTNIPSIHKSCTVEVVEVSLDAWTIMIYMCGADLESDNGFATGDISEILSVNGQPDDVNIIIETGGCTKWKQYGISNSKLGRYHIRNKSLIMDTQLDDVSMGASSTLQSFLEWGLSEYPAEKTGVILWNHGGALDGVCFDEKHNDDSLTDAEVISALSGAFSEVGRTDKLEWIGYDACLMQVQDVASLNADYFNYMIASEESEAGEGWDYDTWVDNLYAGDSTVDVLKAVCDGFIASYDTTYPTDDNDQTLSVLDLARMPAYLSAFESWANSNKTKFTNNKSKTITFLKTLKNYGDSWVNSSNYNYYVNTLGYPTDWFTKDGSYYLLHGYYLYGSFDVKDFLNKVGSAGLSVSSTSSVISALNNLIIYNKIGDEAGESHGLCMICPVTEYMVDYDSSFTKFSNWRSIAQSVRAS